MFARYLFILFALAAGLGAQAAAGLKPDNPTFVEIKALDQKLFQAYNSCDLAALGDMVDEGLEFYHDKGGLSVGKTAFLKAIKENICHKVRRELLTATFEVYPLQNYGAIELGEHTFCNMVETPVCKEETNGIGKFFMLWQKQGDRYRLTRVISYDHLSDWQRSSHLK